MEAPFFLQLACLIALGACSHKATGDTIKKFIPGTYVRASQNEFGKRYDTLVLSLQNESANQYQILRKWRYDRVLDGKPLKPEYKRDKTSGFYSPQKKVLEETETLELFTFDPEKGLLFNGTNSFTKLN